MCSPLQITPRAVLRLKLRPPSVESAKQLRNQLRLHFQVSRLAPSGLNLPYLICFTDFFICSVSFPEAENALQVSNVDDPCEDGTVGTQDPCKDLSEATHLRCLSA